MNVRRTVAIAASTLALAGIAAPASAVRPVTPETHDPAYWESMGYTNCYKIEYSDGLHQIANPGQLGVVLIKAGTDYYGAGYYGEWIDKDISFVIFCDPEYQNT
ncbi:hypothetical protein OEB99_09910 [Actinotalea sp. M2MS4P-6]|uniref:hypothetical protein n=1 Tax=Actinotalea sp. M2MS4P-6 TaxID=2983762 RepID=UPI0021E45AFE|nr:hypothetical protein [Actinotalea sp. M2MS4P-6]MCV2394621.1 hypothetical protein [Actinotalea sp. M2MS4P-6]